MAAKQHHAEQLKLSQQLSQKTAARAAKVCSSIAEVLERMLSDARPQCQKLATHAATTHDVSLSRCRDAFAAAEASARAALSATAATPGSANKAKNSTDDVTSSKEQWEASAESSEVSAELLSLSITADALAARIATFSSQNESRFVSRLHAARATATVTTSHLAPGMRVRTRSGAGEVRKANSGWNNAFVEIELEWGGVLFTQASSLLSFE